MAPAEKRRLLVVDDEPDVCEALRKIAQDQGYEVHTMVRSRDFQSVYEEFRPDVIMLDIVMPELDGVEILKHLAAQNVAIQIIVMTGYNGSYLEKAVDLGRGLGLPAIEGMYKPLGLADVKTALDAGAGNGAAKPGQMAAS